MPSNFLIPKIVKKVMPAVVSILVSENIKNFSKIEIGNGSGFIVDETGVVLTSKHIVSNSRAEYDIITNDGQKYQAEILARDPVSDIAILKIKTFGKNFPTAKLGDSAKLELGEPTIAFGNALGIFQNTVSSGIISGLSRSISAQIDKKSPVMEMRGLIQTDAAINPGNSGGPLVNFKSRVIGINTVMLSGAENIGLAIPINLVKKDLADLKKYGRIKRPLLGVRYIIDDKAKGALIANEGPHSPGIIPDSPADLAGLKEKDVILSIDGEKIGPEKIISDFLEEYSVGDTLTLKVLRNKKEFETKVVLAERK